MVDFTFSNLRHRSGPLGEPGGVARAFVSSPFAAAPLVFLRWRTSGARVAQWHAATCATPPPPLGGGAVAQWRKAGGAVLRWRRHD
jgi:hypothetical protein